MKEEIIPFYIKLGYLKYFLFILYLQSIKPDCVPDHLILGIINVVSDKGVILKSQIQTMVTDSFVTNKKFLS